MATAIEFNHVGKQYRLGLVSTGTLSHDLNRWWQTAILRREDPYLKIGSVNDRATKADSDYVWALRDIDFKVEQGDVVGIIGKNGAGKSTLLKLLSKVTGPTVGTIRARGRIASLLEVGTGFHSEMTGRENIFMNGAILGMTKQEIAAKLDEIVDFSGCERYLDTPVKRYSSGMMVRLGFAVAAHLDPEILVVDEVLAVGDAEFQKKAIGKMRDVSRGEGRTVLFVSHNMNTILSLCTIGVLLENGLVKKTGDIKSVVEAYTGEQSALCSEVDCSNIPRQKDELHCNGVVISKFKIIDPVTPILLYGTAIHGCLTIESQKIVSDVTLRITIKTASDVVVCSSISDTKIQLRQGRNELDIQLDTSYLAPGTYFVSFVLSINGNQYLDMVRRAFYFEIVPTEGFNNGREWDPFWYGNVSGFPLKILQTR